ncbi:gfo/Idh/MocA family oxidoreductase [Anaerobacillus alkaliphilus]|uniref:Gfo/Idh/MocA family oxidoreductase n=1 Tax=Anaerobacillus alkaliphilus TaxID=1548597 RepID=A0A4Q0VSW5_9BACI|nr:Gfo/Idh/MocA family oxidoreductase [Anaerobacillus alkaliphilus]RXI99854.1 gfo/Idh/MocA family oxidoreductase [Anaerobacillus alkaliphilus]
MKKLRVGIIGTGAIAQGAHIPNYQKCNNVEVVAVANHHYDKAEQCAKTFSIPYVFENYEDMLNEVDLDAVSICTPNKFHAEQTIAALHKGCHVLCEKPPAITVEEVLQMEKAAENAGKILFYAFHYRYSPEVITLKKFINANELGEIYSAKATAVRRRGIPGWGVFTNKELQGGGALIDIGVHMLDTALYLMGYPEPHTVLGTTYAKIGQRSGVGLLGKWDWENFSVEDMANAMITFKNGSTLLLEAAFAANVEEKDVMQVSLIGDQGGADVFPLKIFQEKHDTLIDVSPAFLPNYSFHEKEIRDFVNCCLTNTMPESTPHQGLILQKIVNAIYESAKTGEAIRL